MMVFHPRRETCLYERLTFLWLWSAGLSLRSIARRSGRSPHTVRRWLRWWEQNARLSKGMDEHQQYLPYSSSKDGMSFSSKAKANSSSSLPSFVASKTSFCSEEILPESLMHYDATCQCVTGFVSQ